ncbi:COP23 domain-containing protein [Brunnivagina elsteri]|uniref:Circadian oscillating protein COP23 n=1 Tax=Brunnivagina elsteri CCALA 953 TaxID=987040 RepID=A0A2A2TET3_9CYAN|nr:COP23 domain-containing protein [Calothrix elsteri]PAX52176.1 hypothetical protein CK510_20730 [Calothrix elsteri CCALA 953]
MQRQLSSIALALTALTSAATLAISISPAFSQPVATNSQPNKVTFLCREIFDKASGDKIPATVAWIPERKGHISLIGWKSQALPPHITPQKRCEIVTQKFQQFYDNGSLNYLTHGINNGYPVICSIPNQGETCNGTNQLFTIKPGSSPTIVLQRLIDTLVGAGGVGILYQNSGQQVYIDMKEYFKKAPVENIPT